MKSILEEFAHGNINPSVGAIKRGSHYERLGKALVEAEDKITAGLGEELKTFPSLWICIPIWIWMLRVR